MCLNQSVLSCSGTHFIKPSSWGHGSMRPHIYHTNPSGLSPPCTDSMCVIGARPPDQTTHWLPALIHFHFHLLLSVLRFLICTPTPAPSHLLLSICLSLSSTFVLHFSLSPISFFLGGGDTCCRALNGCWTLLSCLCFISFPRVSSHSYSVSQCKMKHLRSLTKVKLEIQLSALLWNLTWVWCIIIYTLSQV